MDVRTGTFALLVVVLGAVGFLLVAPFLQYVLGAALLAFLLYPVHRRLAPRVGSRVSAVTLTAAAFLMAIVPMIVLSLIILSTALEYIERIEEGDIAALQESGRSFLIDQLGLSTDRVTEIEEAIESGLEDVGYTASEFVLSELVSVINTTIHTSFGLMILAFLLYYFLVDGQQFLDWIRRVTPLREDVRSELFDEISNVTWAVIHSHLGVAIVEGILGGIALYLVGVSNVAFWTVVMIVVSIMPVVGIWLVWAPAVGYLLLTGDVLYATLLLVYGITVLSVVDNYLRAIFVDRGSGLHPAVVLVGVVGGIYLLGILGLFLGPVLLAVFKASLTVFAENWNELARPERAAPPQRAE